MATDILGRELAVGDYVMYYNGLYEVLSLPDPEKKYKLLGRQLQLDQRVLICLVIKSESTRPIVKLASELCRVPREDVLMWLLKRES